MQRSQCYCFHSVVIRSYLCRLSQALFFSPSESAANDWNPNISHWNAQRGWLCDFLSCLPSWLVPLTKIKGSSCLTCSTWFGITLRSYFQKQKFTCERFFFFTSKVFSYLEGEVFYSFAKIGLLHLSLIPTANDDWFQMVVLHSFNDSSKQCSKPTLAKVQVDKCGIPSVKEH